MMMRTFAWVAVLAGIAMAQTFQDVSALAGLLVPGNNGAVGLEGSAYAQIPPGETGRGQVTVIINTRQRTYNAVTKDVAKIPRGAQVRVTGIRDGNTLEVTSLASEG